MDTFTTERARLIAAATPGIGAARELAAITDGAVRDLAQAASSSFAGRWALVALGGWGAGALLPSSDLDILVLSDAPHDRLKPFVEAVLYPLWDAQLKVGHQVRSPREQLRAARDDFKTLTASLTARTIAGDAVWAEKVFADCAVDARKRSRALFAELAARPRPGTPYALEPELKEDAGGRRDYDELVWTAAVASGSVQRDPGALVSAGLATAEEVDLATQAAQTIATARFELARAGLGARMTLDATDALEVATPADVQLALARTALVLSRVRRRAAGEVVDVDAPLAGTEVLALLDLGEPALPALEEAAQAGRIDALIPGFSALMTLRRPGIGHELTVGAHSLRAACLLATTGAAEPPSRDRVLAVAALTHDVGKREPGPGHPGRGAAPAREAAARFGLSQREADDVADLVRLHLALAETTTRVDIDDEDAVLSAAARIGRRDLLAPLHRLTAVDSLATGPATWTPWTEALVGGLVARLDAALSEEVDGAGIASRGERVRAEALAACAPDHDAERAFIESAPLRYLASREPAEVVSHARLVAELSMSPSATQARTAVSTGPAPDTFAVTVVAADRPELLARVAGAMSLAGLDILALDAYGASAGVALDTFVVTSATRRPVTTETFAALDRLLAAALRDRLELKTRLTERRHHYPARARGPVTVTMEPVGWDTAVRVSAPDRPGLLHDLAHAVSSCGLDIRWAKVVTVDGMAIDTFHVVGPDGQAVDDPGELGHLAMRLREVR